MSNPDPNFDPENVKEEDEELDEIQEDTTSMEEKLEAIDNLNK